MTGVGSYFYIVWAIWLRLCLNEKQEEYMLRWPSLWFSLPEVIPIVSAEKKAGKSDGNGGVNRRVNGKANGGSNIWPCQETVTARRRGIF